MAFGSSTVPHMVGIMFATKVKRCHVREGLQLPRQCLHPLAPQAPRQLHVLHIRSTQAECTIRSMYEHRETTAGDMGPYGDAASGSLPWA
jgi:hypothetical protein